MKTDQTKKKRISIFEELERKTAATTATTAAVKYLYHQTVNRIQCFRSVYWDDNFVQIARSISSTLHSYTTVFPLSLFLCGQFFFEFVCFFFCFFTAVCFLHFIMLTTYIFIVLYFMSWHNSRCIVSKLYSRNLHLKKTRIHISIIAVLPREFIQIKSLI